MGIGLLNVQMIRFLKVISLSHGNFLFHAFFSSSFFYVRVYMGQHIENTMHMLLSDKVDTL